MNDLLAQRKEIKRLERERGRELRDREEDKAKTAEEVKERELKDFEMVTMGLEKRKRKYPGGEERVSNGEVVKKRREEKEGFGLDEEEMRRLAKEDRERAIKELEREKVGYFTSGLNCC